jgi:hypothetical protein
MMDKPLSVIIGSDVTVSITNHNHTSLWVGSCAVWVSPGAQLADFLAHPVVTAVRRPKSEETGEEVGAIAARLMHHLDPDVRRLAASALTQRPDRQR